MIWLQAIFCRTSRRHVLRISTARVPILFFPGDSTAIYLVEKFAAELNSAGKVVVASPAFRAYGEYALHLELSPRHELPKPWAKNLDVLFFDDSLSSGKTESHAIDAFFRYRPKFLEKSKIRWLTYAVLRRGQRPRSGESAPNHDNPARAKYRDFDYKPAEFGVIGPESLSHATCPICCASARVRNAITWTLGARLSVRELLERLDQLIEARSIEHLASPLPALDVTITRELLRLCGMPMQEACVHLWRCFFQGAQLPEAVEDTLAALLFVGLHHNDVGSYLAHDHVIALIRIAAQAISVERQEQLDAFLIALSVLPSSIVENAMPSLLEVFIASEEVDVIATVLSLVFSGQHHTLLGIFSRESHGHRLETIQQRRSDLIRRVRQLFDHPSPQHHIAIDNVREIALADLSTICSPPSEEKPAWIARTLSALLHKGKHQSFLSDRVDNLSSATVSTVRHGLLQALQLMRRLPATVIDHWLPLIETLTRDTHACLDTDITTCRNLATAVMDDLWKDSIHRKFFLLPKPFQQTLRLCTIAPVDDYHASGVTTEHILLLPCDEATMAREAFGPDETFLTSHLQNLLVNPFTHFPLDKFKPQQGEPPVIVGYLKVDEDTGRLLLVIADRAKPPERENLFTRAHGLANVRAIMQIFGGDVEYIPAAAGILESKHAPTPQQKQYFSERQLDPSCYQNLFVTSFPLMLQII